MAAESAPAPADSASTDRVILLPRLLSDHLPELKEDEIQVKHRSFGDVVSLVINTNRFVSAASSGLRFLSRTSSILDDVPASMAEVDAAFVEEGLKHGGALPRDGTARVSAIDIKPLALNGFLSDVGRCHITYEGDLGGIDPPTTIVLKLAGAQSEQGEALARENDCYHQEASFYRKFAEHIAVGAPHCYAAYESTNQQNVVLMLEDLQKRDGLYFVNQVQGIGRKEMLCMAESLATLHAQHWSWDGAAGFPSWLPHATDYTVRTPCHHAHMKAYLSGAFVDPVHCEKRGVGGEVRKVCLRLCERADEIRNAVRRGPQTLCHNDARSDNVFWGDSNAPGGVVLLDWQLMSVGVGAADLAFVSSNSVTDEPPSETRDRAYVRAYWETLTSRGVDGNRYTFEACWKDYLVGIAWTYTSLTVFQALGDPEELLKDPLCVAMHDRSMQAAASLRVHELATFERLV